MEAFDGYQARFAEITRRAKARFERRDWKGMLDDAAERLDLYTWAVGGIEKRVRATLGSRAGDRLVWASMKAVYSGMIAGREDLELAETFFNSVTRRIFATVGVDPNIEYIYSGREGPPPLAPQPLCRAYRGPLRAPAMVEAIVGNSGFEAPFADLGRDAELAGASLASRLVSLGLPALIDSAEVVRAPFFRRKGAYLLGRAFSGGTAIPFAIALLHTEAGIVIDAILSDEDDISILFSFTRSHFHVDLGPPYPLVRYLRLLMPKKPIAELYIALGHHKHGKTLLYRDLLRHLKGSQDRFVLAPGTPGMVMVVFTLPGHDVVLKVIRDRFPSVKPITPSDVRHKYSLVFRHDRAGRLVEAQEFEHLEFDRARFDPELLEEFRSDADRTVSIEGDRVVVHHAYIERRVTPLDVHLRRCDDEMARAAIADFGQAIKDLAANDIFPGELLPKNFGVTRHGRVVCYDYDELGLLTEFTFRELPEAGDDADALADEAWFGVGPRDVFPEEFRRFLTLPPELRAVLEETHGELYDAAYWREMQARVRRGEIIDIFPYEQARRLHGG